jgi:hypothetical protein
MLVPPEGAAALNETEHAVVPAPVNVLVLHTSALRVDEVVPAAFRFSATLFEEPLVLAVSVAV